MCNPLGGNTLHFTRPSNLFTVHTEFPQVRTNKTSRGDLWGSVCFYKHMDTVTEHLHILLQDMSVQLACKLNVSYLPPYSASRGVSGELRE